LLLLKVSVSNVTAYMHGLIFIDISTVGQIPRSSARRSNTLVLLAVDSWAKSSHSSIMRRHITTAAAAAAAGGGGGGATVSSFIYYPMITLSACVYVLLLTLFWFTDATQLLFKPPKGRTLRTYMYVFNNNYTFTGL